MMTMMMNPTAGVQVKQPVYAGMILHRGWGWRCVGVGDHSKPCRVFCGGGAISRPQPTATTRIKGTTPAAPPPMASGKGNPCLDLWFDESHQAVAPVMPGGEGGENVLGSFSRQHLMDRLLPAAWSHNPLTTLKLIFCFLHKGSDVVDDCKFDRESFYAAAYWLHQNHPKTLASNLPTIAGGSSFGNLVTVENILFRIRLLEVSQGRQHDPKAAADYRFLHDRIADLFAHCLKHDIHNLNEHLRNRRNSNNSNKQVDEEDDDDYCLELSYAAGWCPFSEGDECIGLYESIARKVFPQESYPEYQALDEAAYSLQVQKRLEVDVLEPLERVIGRRGVEQDPGYKVIGSQEEEKESCNKKYLEKLASEETTTVTISLPEADALLPQEIVEYVEDKELGEAAELQWKTMVEHMKGKKEGKLISNWNCLSVCDPFGYGYRDWRNASLALTTLVSQLAQEPWKGKVISSNRKPPQLHTIGDDHHLRSTCSFVEGMNRCDGDFIIDFKTVFDLILQVAVNENLKPDQMIKRVFVFTASSGEDFYHELISVSERWETHDCEAIKSRFKVKGYDLPHLVFWSFAGRSYWPPVPCSAHNGITILSGFNDCLVKSFLDNHGDIGLDHVMEVAISAQQYQDLVVVD